MLDEISDDAQERMGKSLESLRTAFARIRTGRANPSLLDTIEISYYDVPTPLNQVSAINVEDGRTLVIAPWEKGLIGAIEKAIMTSDIGITPNTSGDVIRLPMPPLSEENRKDLVKHARAEAENARIAVRNIRRDAISDVRDLAKEKMVAEDDAHKAEDAIQKLTDVHVKHIDQELDSKESDLMQI